MNPSRLQCSEWLVIVPKRTESIMNNPTSINRRTFIKSSGAIATGLALTQPFAIASNTPKRQIKIGMIGCGGRGNWISDLLLKHGGFQIVAAADYFQDRLDEYSVKFSVPAGSLFSGLSGYKKLLELKQVDAVLIESPPYFHPEQAEAAVKAGKHVFLAKPIAVDVPGSLSVGESGELARRKGLCFLVDFQTRANMAYQEAVKRVHNGAIGEYSFNECWYHAGNPFENRPSTELLMKDPANPEYRLRAWGLDQTLSGDIITEQNIHTLDVTNWLMQKNPISAFGNCSGKTRDLGDCNDHFSVIYKYADDVDANFHSRQFQANGTKPDGIYNRMFGTKGALETKYSGDIILRGKPSFRGDSTGVFASGAEANLETFYQDILNGNASNLTVPESVNSTLLSVLGREAAYSGKVITWQEMLQQNKRLQLDLDLKA